jgi:methylated-DNA-protein-cysteine methyltransferase-like protein
MLPIVVAIVLEPDRRQLILDRIRRVPEGYVRTYGDVSPGAPRLAGAVLSACTDPTVPWHRIVRADGSLAQGDRQRRLLVREGVPFRGGRVDMAVVRLPEDAIDLAAEDLLPEPPAGVAREGVPGGTRRRPGPRRPDARHPGPRQLRPRH